MAFINIPGKDNNTTLSPDEFNYFVNKVNSLKLAILQGSGFVGSLRISDIPDIDGWYFASETGTYTNAGNLVIDNDGNLNIIIVSNFGQTFSIVETPIPQGEALETEVLQHSLKGVESDGIWDALYGTLGLSESINSVQTDTDINTQNILALSGGLNLQGFWNANTNIPNISSSPSINDYWIVEFAGTTTLGSDSVWNEGDWVIYSNGGWMRLNGNIYLNGTSLAQTLSISGNTISISDGNSINLQPTTFNYGQGVPAAVWEIPHFLNKYPSVVATDSAGNVVKGQIKYIDSNNLIVTFNSSFSGSAYMN